MLIELHIEDLGVIDRVDLLLGPGLTALTGETGAGKTMLVEAINLLVGGRADATIVRPGALEARVEGRFVSEDGDTEHVLARVIPVDGRSRAYLNGRLATVANLAEIGAGLVDMHGQHTHQSLLGAATQRAALDRFGAIDLTPLQDARVRLHEIDAALGALGGDARSRAREIDLLRFQVDDIEAAAVSRDDEEADLEQLEDVLAGAVAHREAALVALDRLQTDGGVLDQLGSAINAVANRSPFQAITERLRGAVAEIGDASTELRGAGEAIEEDPQRLEQLRARRQQLRDLRRKYGDTLADVRGFQIESAARLDELESYESRTQALDMQRQVAQEDETAAAAVIGAARRLVAPRLATAVTCHLHELAMPHAQIAIEVGDDPGDDVRFLLAANPGSPLLALNRVASGGELARSMLALRLVLSQDPATLVFDEVDAGVGGSAAVAIGRSLATLGDHHQVLVVTHLPQVAACAGTQIVVRKDVAGGVTSATASVVSGEGRVAEIARMLSGRAASRSARDHAIELLDQRVVTEP